MAQLKLPTQALIHAFHCVECDCTQQFGGTSPTIASATCTEVKAVLRRTLAHVRTCPLRQSSDPSVQASQWSTPCKVCALWDALHGTTPRELTRQLVAAAPHNDVELMRKLLARAVYWPRDTLFPCDVVNAAMAIDHFGDVHSALSAAIHHGATSVVELLLTVDGIDVNGGPKPPLLVAATRMRSHIAGKLLAAGADVELTNVPGYTPLAAACFNRDLHTVRVLCSYGAKRTFQEARGGLPAKTAESTARARGDASTVAFLKESAEWSLLAHLEVLSMKRARALLDGGAVVDGVGAGSPSPLARAKALCPDRDFVAGLSAHLVLELGAPWTRVTHEFYPPPVRSLGRELMRIAYAIRIGKAAHEVDGALRPFAGPAAVADVFELYVIPRLLASTEWDCGVRRGLKSARLF